VLLSGLIDLNCEPRESTPLIDIAPHPYPHARWRIASRRELDNVVLWLSHIQIRHEGTSDLVAFSPVPWRTGAERPRRGRSAAAVLAQQIGETARREPERFGQLATIYSDDILSKDNGGHLGGVVAINLSPFPEVLDALATLDEASVSNVVETEYGFHLFRRDSAPTGEEIGGAHVVIQHTEAPWLKDTLGVEPAVVRSRQDAIALAEQVYRQALEHTVPFADLVARYSEHPDRIRGGDMGQWSLAKPSPYLRELDRLRRVAVGEIVGPLDTMWGVQVLQRTATRARTEYAMQAIKVAFGPSLPRTATNSKESVRNYVRDVTKRVHQDPAFFDHLRRELCCLHAERWFEGQEDLPSLSQSVGDLAFGEIAHEPVEQLSLFIIPKRIDPEELEPSPIARAHLPAPERPAVEFFVEVGRLTEQDFAACAEFSIPKLGLDTKARAALRALHNRDLGNESTARTAGYRRLLADARTVLGADGYARYIQLHDAYFATLLLEEPATGM